VTVLYDITGFPCVDYQHLTRFTLGKQVIGGRGGIRTHDGNNPMLDFESSAFDRAQPPFLKNQLINLMVETRRSSDLL
jgi:hypothetical protein